MRFTTQPNKDYRQDLIIMSPTGKFEWIDKKIVLVLFNGTSYEGLEEGESLVVRKFNRFEGYLPEVQIKPLSKTKHEISSYELWQSEEIKQQTMLQWRIIIPVSIIILGLLGLKMSKTKPREGRFAKLFIALILYVIFNQLLVTNKELLEDGNLSSYVGLWIVPLLFLIYSLRKSK